MAMRWNMSNVAKMAAAGLIAGLMTAGCASDGENADAMAKDDMAADKMMETEEMAADQATGNFVPADADWELSDEARSERDRQLKLVGAERAEMAKKNEMDREAAAARRAAEAEQRDAEARRRTEEAKERAMAAQERAEEERQRRVAEAEARAEQERMETEKQRAMEEADRKAEMARKEAEEAAMEEARLAEAEREMQQETSAEEERYVNVVMETTYGSITIALDKEKAPVSVENFLSYVEDGGYDGTIFHRVIDGFMIQGGGFTPDMDRKPTEAPIENEWRNGLSNDRGTIAMARTNDPNSATNQFFINVVDNGRLSQPISGGAGYAVFGKVVEGMDVVDAIKNVATGVRGGMGDVPLEPVVITSVKTAE